MRCLLLVAHGSRRAASNDEVRALTERLAGAVGEAFENVDCAFLELTEPTITQGLEAAVGRGATEVVVLPYFLARGAHVGEDIPRVVEDFRALHPAITVRLKPHLGALDGVVALLAGAAGQGDAA